MTSKKIFTLWILFLFVLASAVYAQPKLPSEFFGTATINGRAAEVGSLITAEINGVQRGTYTLTSAGLYGGSLLQEGKLAVFDGNTGDTITFFIQTPSMGNRIQAAQTGSWASGSTDELNLIFTGTEEPKASGSTGSTGSTGGSGGAGSSGAGASGNGASGAGSSDSSEDGTPTATQNAVGAKIYEIDSDFLTSDVAALKLNKGDGALFTLLGEQHSITLKSVSGFAILVTVSSDPFDVVVNKNEPKSIDINSDGTDDIKITITKIVEDNNYVELSLEKLAQPVIKADTGSIPVTGLAIGDMTTIGGIIVIIIIILVIAFLAMRKKSRKAVKN